MKKIYLVDIEGSNIANVKYALQNYFEVITIKNPKMLDDESPNIVLPGNGSFGYYISFLQNNGWLTILEGIINRKFSGKLFCICSGFQALGVMSDESEGIKGPGFIDYSFRSLEKFFKSYLIINIGRKEIMQSENCLTLKDLGFSNDLINKKVNKPYFVHGYGAQFNSNNLRNTNKYCYLYTEVNKKKLLAGLISKNFCATQFHPELSGSAWREFMINFFK